MSSGKNIVHEVAIMFSNIFFAVEDENSVVRVCKLKSSVQSLAEASFSPLLTLGAFLLFHHPDLQPPGFHCGQKTNGKVDVKYPNEFLTVNNLHELWNDYLSNLVVEGKVYQQGNQIYLLDFVRQEYADRFDKSSIFEIIEVSKESIQKYRKFSNYAGIVQQIYGLEKKDIPKTKKYAAICLAVAPAEPQVFMPRVHVGALYFGIFYRQTDVWKIFKPLEGIFPTQEELDQFDGVVLSGSAHSVYEDVPQVNLFMEMLIKSFRKNQKLRILGFCFGHQSIAYAFGGQVQKMPQKVVHLENIRMDVERIKQLKLEWFDSESPFLNGKEEYLISEFHGDAVVKVPQGFTIVGQSETCLNEAMSSNDGRVLSYQFHMEYTPEFAGAFELRLHSYDPNCRYGRIYDGSSKIQGCDRNLRSVLQLREVSRNFLDARSFGSQWK